MPLHAPRIPRYVSKISGLLLEGIDIHIEVPAVKYKELRAPSQTSMAAKHRGADLSEAIQYRTLDRSYWA